MKFKKSWSFAALTLSLLLAACGAAPNEVQKEPSVPTAASGVEGSDEAIEATTSAPVETDVESSTPEVSGAAAVPRFDFETPTGYRFRMVIDSVDLGVDLNVADAPPGKAHVSTAPSILAHVTNLLPNKNFGGGNTTSYQGEQVLTLHPLYPSSGIVCDLVGKEVGVTSLAGVCTTPVPGFGPILIGLSSIPGGATVEIAQGSGPYAKPGARGSMSFTVPENQGEALSKALAKPVGYAILSDKGRCIHTTVGGC